MLALAGLLALALGRADQTPIAGSAPGGEAQEKAKSAYGQLPLSFVPNTGQTDARVRYYAQAGGRSFFFTPDKAVLSFAGEKRGMALDLRFLGASPHAKVLAQRPQKGTVNYLNGSEHHTGLHSYGQVTYRNLWPGIDLSFRGAGGTLKYEFLVHPGARVSDIGLAYAGASGLSLTDAGALRIKTPLGPLTDAAPRSYQVVDGRRVPVSSRFRLGSKSNAYGFAAGRYDRSRSLVIDPGLAYSTYLGGGSTSFNYDVEDRGLGIAVDGQGDAYVTGWTYSPDFPTTPGAFDVTFDGSNTSYEAFVTKLNQDGTGLVYSTYLGLGVGTDILVDGAGDAYVTGYGAAGFPTTPGAYDTIGNGGSDAFVAKLNPSGSSLVFSTLLGGSFQENPNGLALDDQGNIYLSGQTTSADFPTTPGAYDNTRNDGGQGDVFVAKLSADASSLVYSTYIGGSNSEIASVAVDATGNAYVAGTTFSSNFPTTPGAYDSSFGGYADGFVTKLNADGSGLLYSTYLGVASYDQIGGVAVDGQGSVYVAGSTIGDFPTTPGAFDTTYDSTHGLSDGFVTKFNPAGSALVYSTFLGGGAEDALFDLTLDGRGNAYVTGYADSANFPVTPNAFDKTHNDQGTGSRQDDVIVSVLNAAGSRLLYSTYLGGLYTDDGNAIAIDGDRNAYVTGYTVSPNFPTSPGAYDTSLTGNYDAFVTKFSGVTAPSYEIPGSASQLSTSLVPTFRPCGTPGNPTNAQHSPPLGVGSCTPPRPGGVARIGAQSTMTGSLTVVPGDHIASNGDQADVTVNVGMSDVTTAAGSDYAPNPSGPDMTLYARLRLTDSDNGASGEDPGTVGDFDFAVPIDCTTTPSGAVGSDCFASTSADTITPGLIKEDKSTVLQTFRLRVNDSGANGIRGDADDAIFATQGIFEP